MHQDLSRIIVLEHVIDRKRMHLEVSTLLPARSCKYCFTMPFQTFYVPLGEGSGSIE